MTRLLLTGAGFTKNWGGWLGDEAFEFLLGSNLSKEIRDELWSDKNSGQGFEVTLAKFQQRAEDDSGQAHSQLMELNDAVTDMFIQMNTGLSKKEILPSISNFLTKFDAIFTLNQDLLLEKKYSPFSLIGKNFERPGINQSTQWEPYYKPLNKEDLRIEPNVQPYFKLHGSSDWQYQDGRDLLVLGGKKIGVIKNSYLLAWYNNQFKKFLSAPNARLMVIGYSFNDEHITQSISVACEAGLKLFVVDPNGVDVFEKNRFVKPTAGDEIFAILEKVAGASRRPLIQTFDQDDVELTKFRRFMGVNF